ncbi:hypothetical protein D5R93_12490 [Actinomyces lilanjuaniae]|uniref:Uncharacterized protein n=1 Tax=Actinomyces lilanjuaniae TaxID=2321394 RepID=A0ABN5PQC8_9ACTO|nr:hypothetical protein D5R93_12490 [Actinomyces lilanjuaniae]
MVGVDGRADYDADYDHGRCAQALEKQEKARERRADGPYGAGDGAEARTEARAANRVGTGPGALAYCGKAA